MGRFELKLALGVSLAVSCGYAQSSDDKRPKIDVDSYTIDAQINLDTQTITARASVRFTPVDDRLTSAVFELNNNLNISRVVDDRGTPIPVSRNQQENSVRLSFPGVLPPASPR